MLSNIKNLINSKKAYMEATKLILENEELDDSIVLNEEPVEPEIKEDETIEVSTDEEPVVEPAEQPLPVPGEEVPSDNTEVQVDDDNSDLLTAEIDLTTNTQVDSLPVPPSNASDAIVGDDFMNQTIDSGFGNEEEKAPIETTEDIMAEPVDDQSEKVEETIDESKNIDDEDLMAMSLDEILDELKKNKEDDSEHKEESTDIMSESIDEIEESTAYNRKLDEWVTLKKKIAEQINKLDSKLETTSLPGERQKIQNMIKKLNEKYMDIKQSSDKITDFGHSSLSIGRNPNMGIEGRKLYGKDAKNTAIDVMDAKPVEPRKPGEILEKQKEVNEINNLLKQSQELIESTDIMNMDIDTEPFTEDRAWKNKMQEMHNEFNRLEDKYKELEKLKAETTSDGVKRKLDDKMKEVSNKYKHLTLSFNKLVDAGDLLSNNKPTIPDLGDDPENYMGIKYDKYYNSPYSINGFKDDTKEKKPGFYLRAQKALNESTEAFEEFIMSEEFDSLFQEAISVGDEAPAEGSGEPAPDSTEAPAEEDNTVTAAVKDKVDEISTDNTVDGTSTPAFSSKEELMKKLSSLTKSLEDAKSLVMGEMK